MPKPSERGIFEHPQKSPFSHERYDSRWEREQMEYLEKDPVVVKWTKNHNIRIPFVDDAGFRKYYEPDFLVERVDGLKEIQEIKGGHLMNRETELKVNAARIFCKTRNMIFKLITK